LHELSVEFLQEMAASLAVGGLLAVCAVSVWALWGVNAVLGISAAVVILIGLSFGVAAVLYTGPWRARRFLKGLITAVTYIGLFLLGG
jgi:hypothetical protein